MNLGGREFSYRATSAFIFVHSLDRKVSSLITRDDTDDVSVSAIKLGRRLEYDE